MLRPFVVLVSTLVAALVLAPLAHANGLLATTRDGRKVEDVGGRPAVELRSHRVEARLDDRVASVTVEQVFYNRTEQQLEGTYLFPLPDGASVSGFAMTMGDKVVQGEIVEADKARAIYEGIVRQRRDPGLLEYVGRGLFRAKVFPIPPAGDVMIRMTFQQVVPEDAGTMELRYPLATDRFHAQAVQDVVVDVTIASQADIRTIYSPSHDVEVARDGTRKARVSYEGSGRRQTRDFLLYIGRSADAVAFSCLSHKPAGERGTFLSIFAPPTTVPDGERAAKDVVYVLDTSGSMEKDGKMEQARRALDHGVHVLAPEDRFNIVAFASDVRTFRDGLIPATAEAQAQATAWIGERGAKGGTDIGAAMRRALAMGTEGRLLLVVLITDGKPTVGIRNRQHLVELVRADNRSNARVFTFGVGFDLDVELLDRIAEATRGARDYVAPQEELEIVTSRFFTKVNHPVMTDVSIDFGKGVGDVYPRHVTDLFAGSQILLFGRYETPGKRTVSLSGRVAGRQVTHEYEVDLSAKDGLDYLPRLWAHRKVAYLVDDVRLHGETQEVVDEVVELATRYGIVTPYTSGLVVEEAELEGRVNGANPIADLGGRRGGGISSGSGGGGRFRGPGGAVPPGLREPTDPTPAPPPPPSGPPTTPSTPTTPTSATPDSSAGIPRFAAPAPTADPAEKIADSKRLKSMMDRQSGGQGDLEHELVKATADKTFVKKDGVWVDSVYDPETHKERVEIEAWSEAWFDLMKKDPKIAKYLALGEDLTFVYAGKAYVVRAPVDDAK